ncbi:hypothetical protein B0T24DRAFT_147597 [Lasiosphaeria ovina]|uniref:Uncharacterized protein n=1 Tax=Lasiosphaeria ovina TaxID=92902 RepID=A0AAE0KN49_9PEZI|nr:hypothetical protein B0T24DRAFT_147597 [Lasiosphaeria ovina]
MASYPTPSAAPGPGPAAPSSVISSINSRQGLGPRRLSRFTEETNMDLRPTASVLAAAHAAEADDADQWYDEDGFSAGIHPDPIDASRAKAHQMHVKAILQAVSSTSHALLCVVVTVAMAMFLRHLGGDWIFYKPSSSQAVALLVLLGLDISLDILSLLRLPHTTWPVWALLLRMTFGIGYVTLFLVYIGIGHVFPNTYTFWAIPPDRSGPVIYLFLWLLGVWNLIHAVLCRHQIAKSARAYFTTLASLPNRRFRDSNSSRRTSGQSATTGWSAWRRSRGSQIIEDDPELDLQRTRRAAALGLGSSGTLTLGEQQSPEGHKHESGVTTAASSIHGSHGPSQPGGRDGTI